jgi:hypothetical protein
MPANLRPLAARLALTLSALALTLLMAEVACRMLGVPFRRDEARPASENRVARFDGELGWSYIPQQSAKQRYGRPAREILEHFDARGLRAPRPDQDLDPDRPTLLFVGGSFTMGHGVAFEASFPARVATGALASCQVANAGVQGYGSDQSLLLLRRHAGAFKTVAVIYTYMDDHLRRNGNRDRRLLHPDERFLGTKPVFALDPDGRPSVRHPPLRYRDYRFSHLAALIALRLPAPEPVALTRALIETMRRESEALGAAFVAVDWGWPQGGRDRPSLFGPLEADGMRVLYTEESPPRDWRYMVIPGAGHPTAQAHGHVARRLREKLRRAGVSCPTEGRS